MLDLIDTLSSNWTVVVSHLCTVCLQILNEIAVHVYSNMSEDRKGNPPMPGSQLG